MTERVTADPAGAEPAGSVPVKIKAIPVRHYGRWVAAVVVVALFAVIVGAFANGNINWGAVPSIFTRPVILKGAWNTLLISVSSMVLGVALGILAAVMRMSPNPVTSSVSAFYIWFFRGTPVLVQILIWYNLALVFPNFTIPGIYTAPMNSVITPFMAALLGLGINEGAYMAEIVRAGIVSIDEGQTEAAQALGMSSRLTTRRIVLPQAMRVILPPTGNEFNNMLKTSSLASVAQYPELLKASDNLSSTSLAVVEGLFAISIWYLILTTIFSIGQYFLERRYARGQRRQIGLLEQLASNLALRIRRPQDGGVA